MVIYAANGATIALDEEIAGKEVKEFRSFINSY